MRTLTLCTLIAALAVGGALAQGTPVAVVHFNADQWNADFPQSNFARFWNDPAIVGVRSMLLQELSGEMEGADLSRLSELLHGEIAFVVTLEPPATAMAQPRPHVALAFRQSAGAEAVLGTITSMIPDPSAQQELRSMALTQGDILVFSDTPTLAQLVADRLPQGPGGFSIEPQANAFINGRVNLGFLVSQLGTLSGDQSTGMVMAALGLGNLRALDMSSGFEGTGLESDGALTFHGNRAGLMSILGPNGEFGVLDLTPAGCPGVAAMRIMPPAQIWDWAQQMAMQMGGPQAAQSFQQMGQMAQMQIGMDLRNQVLPAIGGEIAVLTGTPANPMVPEMAFVIESNDDATLNQLVQSVVQMAQMMMGGMMMSPGQQPMAPPPPQQVTQSGVTYTAVSLMGQELCWGFLQGHLVISSSRGLMNSICDASATGQTIRQAPGFQAIASQIALDGAMFSYSDSTAMQEMGNQMVAGMAMGMQMGGADPQVMQMMNAIPVALQYLGQSGSSVRVSDDRIDFHSHSTSGVEPLIVGGLLPAIAIPNFLEAQTRSKVARARADLRSLATGLEAFYVDNNRYPRAVAGSDPTSISRGDPMMAMQSTFSTADSITSPIAYLTGYMEDPFGPTGAPYCYFSDAHGWILVSAGPDGDFDFDPKQVYHSDIAQPSVELIRYAYDPTNGTVSDGDVFRVRQ
ncbi:type II secretion system protein GspG [Candidatus Sumerlaeota bacterium]|nr:type II secretion system protein GspG [Candidatus Sumerlaeota bacterium]